MGLAGSADCTERRDNFPHLHTAGASALISGRGASDADRKSSLSWLPLPPTSLLTLPLSLFCCAGAVDHLPLGLRLWLPAQAAHLLLAARQRGRVLRAAPGKREGVTCIGLLPFPSLASAANEAECFALLKASTLCAGGHLHVKLWAGKRRKAGPVAMPLLQLGCGVTCNALPLPLPCSCSSPRFSTSST